MRQREMTEQEQQVLQAQKRKVEDIVERLQEAQEALQRMASLVVGGAHGEVNVEEGRVIIYEDEDEVSGSDTPGPPVLHDRE